MRESPTLNTTRCVSSALFTQLRLSVLFRCYNTGCFLWGFKDYNSLYLYEDMSHISRSPLSWIFQQDNVKKLWSEIFSVSALLWTKICIISDSAIEPHACRLNSKWQRVPLCEIGWRHRWNQFMSFFVFFLLLGRALLMTGCEMGFVCSFFPDIRQRAESV